MPAEPKPKRKRREPNRIRSGRLRHDHATAPAVTLPTLDEVCPPAGRPRCVQCGATLTPWWIAVYTAGGGDLSRPPDPAAVAPRYGEGRPYTSGMGEYRAERVYARTEPYEMTGGLGVIWEGWNGLYLGAGGDAGTPHPFCGEGCAAAYGIAAYRSRPEPMTPPTEERT